MMVHDNPLGEDTTRWDARTTTHNTQDIQEFFQMSSSNSFPPLNIDKLQRYVLIWTSTIENYVCRAINKFCFRACSGMSRSKVSGGTPVNS